MPFQVLKEWIFLVENGLAKNIFENLFSYIATGKSLLILCQAL